MHDKTLPRRRLAGALAAAALLAGAPSLALADSAPQVVADPYTGTPMAVGDPAEGSTAGAYLAGLIAGLHDDLPSAAGFLLEVQAADPENPGILVLTFLTAAAAGLGDEAAALAPAVLAYEPTNYSAILTLVVEAARAGDWAAVARELTALPQGGLPGATAELMRAWQRLGEGRPLAEAVAAMESLAAQPGLAVLYWLHSALLADVAGDVAAAQAGYEEALAASEGRSLRLTLLAGNFYARQGKTERAIALYRVFLSDGPGSGVVEQALEAAERGEVPEPLIAAPEHGLAEVMFQMSSILVQEQAMDPALVQAHLALRLRPDFHAARLLLGELLQRRDRGAEAVAVYRDIPESSPYHWGAGLNLAEELYVLGESEEAIATYEALAEDRPGEMQPLFQLGNLLRLEKRFEEAAAAYERAVERLGEVGSGYWALLYYRGIAYERMGDWEKAEADFLRTLELQPEQPQVMNYLAYSWVEQHVRLAEALAMLKRAVELRPTDGYIVDSLGWALYRLEDYQGAVEQLERAVELSPAEPVINDHLGDAYWQVGRTREARVQWQRTLSLAPSDDLDPAVIRRKIEEGLATPLPEESEGDGSDGGEAPAGN